jgi:hypothetical protein
MPLHKMKVDPKMIGFEHEHDVFSYFKIASSILEEKNN